MRLSECTRLLRLVIFGVVIIWAVANPAYAADSLRTVSEFGHRVLNNLDIVDTLEGSAKLDSIEAQRMVRDAVIDVGTLIPTEKAKTITTTSGTFGYLVDTHFDSLQAAILKKGRWARMLETVSWHKLIESYKQMGSAADTGNIVYAAINGDSVYFYPVPARTDTVYLIYTARGTVPTAHSSTVDLPHELYSAVEYLATVRAAKKVGNVLKEQAYKESYVEEIAKFLGGKKPQ